MSILSHYRIIPILNSNFYFLATTVYNKKIWGVNMNKKRVKKLLSYYKPYLNIFTKDMLAAFIVAAISLIIPLVARYITNTVLVSETLDRITIILQCGGFLIVLAIIEFFANHYIIYQGHLMGMLMERDIRKELFEQYQKLSFNFYDNSKTGQLISRITSDTFSLTELYHHGPEDIVLSILKIVGAFIILGSINLTLTLILFAFIPIILITIFYFNGKMEKAFKQHKINTANFSARIEDNLSGIRVVKSFSNEALELHKFDKTNDALVQTRSKAMKYMADYDSLIKFVTTILTVIIIILGTIFIEKDLLAIGDLVVYLLYINNFIDPVKRLVSFSELFQDGLTGFERFMDIMEIHPDIQDKPDSYPLKDVIGEVSFNDVAFKYEQSEATIFNHVNLKVKAGEYIALVGSSGVGKTTLCSLIPRFYDTSAGSITIDGHNIQDVTLKSLRRNIGIVQQDIYLFSGNVYDNIGYGKVNATHQEIEEAAKLANADEFIQKLPNGYLTDIGQNGVKLSGGQNILIFDEATSALDNESEKIVQDSLESLAKNRTTFVIAHRLSTIKNAKRIIVLHQQGIVEEGNHQQLLATGGIYANLYNMQFVK